MASAAPAPERRLKGRCYCGQARFEVADAFRYAANCHCAQCRRTTGSAFKPFAGIERGKLAVTAGAEALLIVGEADNHNAHCSRCGSLLFSVVRDGAYVHVALGTLDARRVFDPTITSSSVRRRPGTRSPTTSRNSRGMRIRRIPPSNRAISDFLRFVLGSREIPRLP